MNDRGCRFLGLCLALVCLFLIAGDASAQTPACAAAWSSSTAYVGGNTVSRVCAGVNKNYTANWWTQGNDPCTSSGPSGSGQPWQPGVACGGGATATATTAPRATATSTTAPRATATSTTAPRATGTSTATATRTATPTATATTSGGSCSAPAWNSTTAYNGGQQVSRVCGGTTNLYTAAFWTQGNDPCTSSGGAGSGQPWVLNGVCGPTPTPGPTPTSGPTAPPGAVNLHHALYLMPFNNPIPIQQYINETGLKSYMISFILSNGGCTAAWDGTQPLNSSTVSSLINTIRSNGGDIAISQGGYGGFPAHWDPKLRIPRGQVVAAASIVSPKY